VAISFRPIVSVFALTFLLLGQRDLLAQGFGKIIGTVFSSDEKVGLAGANILVQGTVLGATSKSDGRFVIAGVPVGTYSLLFSRVGYERKVVSGLVVRADDSASATAYLAPLPIQSEGVVVTASKRDQRFEEIPVSVSVVDAKTIEERNSITIDEALRYVSGVNMIQSQVNIRGMSGYSRGIGSRVLVLLDGLPLLTGDTGEITWETLPTLQIERLEVVKGAGSALYGSSALGGVINVLTKEIKEGTETRVRAYTGFYDEPFYSQWKWSEKTRFLNGAAVNHAQRRGSLAWLLSTSRTNDDGYRENDFYHRWNAFGKLSYDFSSYENATVSLNFLSQKKGSFFWWRNLQQALQSDGDQAAFRITTSRWNANLSYRKIVGENFSYTAKGVYFSSFLQNDSLGVLGSSGRAHTGIVELQANLLPARRHTVTFGFVASYDDIGSDLYGRRADAGLAAYVQDEIKLDDNVLLTGGARYDYEKVFGLEAASQVSPKIGVVYSPTPRTSLRASLGRGFRAPSIGEIYISAITYAAAVVPNIDLKPEHSWSYEIGGSHLIADRLLLDAALFGSEFSDLIEAGVSFDVDRNAPVIKFNNVTKARIQGAEMSIKSDWLRRMIHAEVSYTYVWPKDRTENRILRFRPRHLFYVSGSMTYKALSVGVDFRYVSKVDRVDEQLVQLVPIRDGAVRVPIKVVDARASVDLASIHLPIVLRFNVNNLAQYNYVELMGNVSPIRNFVFTAEAKF
jgi:outer membrane receptor for ferrienterochelin and colicins